MVAVWTGVSAAVAAAGILAVAMGLVGMPFEAWLVALAWSVGIGVLVAGLNAWIFHLLIFRPLKDTLQAIDRMQPVKGRGNGLHMGDDWPGTLRSLAHEKRLTHASACKRDVKSLVRDTTICNLIKVLKIKWDFTFDFVIKSETFLRIIDVIMTNMLVKSNSKGIFQNVGDCIPPFLLVLTISDLDAFH